MKWKLPNLKQFLIGAIFGIGFISILFGAFFVFTPSFQIKKDISKAIPKKTPVLGGDPSYTVDSDTATYYISQSHAMARQSNGTLWVAYRKNNSLWIAHSENDGVSWDKQEIWDDVVDKASYGGNLATDSNDVVHCAFFSYDTGDDDDLAVRYTNSTDWSEVVEVHYNPSDDSTTTYR
jgi:hypothetical protein